VHAAKIKAMAAAVVSLRIVPPSVARSFYALARGGAIGGAGGRWGKRPAACAPRPGV